MKKHLKRILVALAIYFVLLLLLLAAEGGSPGASIRTFGEAVWFSLITMTTVGYGDRRVIGVVFALCSIGILTALIGLVIRLLSGEFLPRVRMRRGKAKRWYVFHEENEDAAALARALQKDDPDCLLIFPAGGEKLVEGPAVLRFDWTHSELIRLRGGTQGLRFFFLGQNDWENVSGALAACECGAACVCKSEAPIDRLSGNMEIFSPLDAMSRSYWKNHPLRSDEHCVVLLGCGEAGSALLERALITNVFESGQNTEYHVFDDTAGFAALHPEAVRALSAEKTGEDALIFHTEDWAVARELLQRADRILVAYDDEELNFKIWEELRTWFGTAAALHVRLPERVPGIESFGGRDENMRPEFVIKDEINRRARLMNDIYNEASGSPTPWEELGSFMRQSNIAAADHLIVKARFLLHMLEMEHRRWMRFYQMFNWKYDPVRNDEKRRHPMLVPYKELAESERKKDAFAWEILGRLSEKE